MADRRKSNESSVTRHLQIQGSSSCEHPTRCKYMMSIEEHPWLFSGHFSLSAALGQLDVYGTAVLGNLPYGSVVC